MKFELSTKYISWRSHTKNTRTSYFTKTFRLILINKVLHQRVATASTIHMEWITWNFLALAGCKTSDSNRMCDFVWRISIFYIKGNSYKMCEISSSTIQHSILSLCHVTKINRMKSVKLNGGFKLNWCELLNKYLCRTLSALHTRLHVWRESSNMHYVENER